MPRNAVTPSLTVRAAAAAVDVAAAARSRAASTSSRSCTAAALRPSLASAFATPDGESTSRQRATI